MTHTFGIIGSNGPIDGVSVTVSASAADKEQVRRNLSQNGTSNATPPFKAKLLQNTVMSNMTKRFAAQGAVGCRYFPA